MSRGQLLDGVFQHPFGRVILAFNALVLLGCPGVKINVFRFSLETHLPSNPPLAVKASSERKVLHIAARRRELLWQNKKKLAATPIYELSRCAFYDAEGVGCKQARIKDQNLSFIGSVLILPTPVGGGGGV